MDYRNPEPLGADHELDAFDCGEPVLDDWLKRHARSSHAGGSARINVATSIVHPRRVVGYHALAAAQVEPAEATARLAKAQPAQRAVPVVRLAWLTVDRAHRRRHLGSSLLRDAMLRVLQAADAIGVRALVVHAKHDRARAFYEQYGFEPSPTDPMHLILLIKDLRRFIERTGTAANEPSAGGVISAHTKTLGWNHTAVPPAAPPPAPRRELLLVAQLAPPSNLSAARRVAGLVKYLDRLGYRVTVLTSMSSGRGELPGGAHVLRTRDLLVSPINWRRESFASLAGGGGGAGYEETPSRLASLFVPDLAMVGWLPFALRRALALAAAHRFDAVLTTSPPHSGHLVGLALHGRGLPWVADFRDGWTFESDRPAWPLSAQRALDRGLERAVAVGADSLVAVTEPIAADLGTRFEREVTTITNGFDPEEHSNDAPAVALGAAAPASDRHSLLHAGRMAYAGRSPAPLLAALERAPELRARLEVLFAGPLSAQERELIARPELDGAARAVGSLDRERTLALQSRSDSLLVLTSGHRRGEATQKVFEYLAAGKPILVLGEDTEAARIVTDAGGGIVAPADDPDAIGAALRRLVDGEATAASMDGVRRYSYAQLAREMAEQVERAITARGLDASAGASTGRVGRRLSREGSTR